MGGNASLEFETGVVVNSNFWDVVVRVANTGENGEHVSVYLMPGFSQLTDLDLSPYDTEVLTFNLGGKGAPTQLNWLRIRVSTDQVVPTASLSDDSFGSMTYLPGDFAAFSLLESGGKTRLW